MSGNMSTTAASGERLFEALADSSLLDHRNLDSDIRLLEVRVLPDGRYRVLNNGKVVHLPRVVAYGKTPDEALRKARRILVRNVKDFLAKQRLIATVLLRKLEVTMWNGQWLLPERDFRILLGRIKRAGFGIYGIEVWRPTHRDTARTYDLATLKLYDQFAPTPEQSWFMRAFEELAASHPVAMFSCTISIPRTSLVRNLKSPQRRAAVRDRAQAGDVHDAGLRVQRRETSPPSVSRPQARTRRRKRSSMKDRTG